MVLVPSSEAESSQKRRDLPGPAHYQPHYCSSDESSWEMESDLENKSTSGSSEVLAEKPEPLKIGFDDLVEETKGGKKGKAHAVQKTWNLRPRNEAGRCRTQAEIESQLQKEKSQVKPSSSRKTTVNKDAVKKEKPKKFSIALSQEEIAEDIFKMTGSKPSSRPAKRDKKLQHIVDVRKSCSTINLIFDLNELLFGFSGF